MCIFTHLISCLVLKIAKIVPSLHYFVYLFQSGTPETFQVDSSKLCSVHALMAEMQRGTDMRVVQTLPTVSRLGFGPRSPV